MIFDKGWLLGVWNIGNDYRNKTAYHGAYPRSYLERMQVLFPSATLLPEATPGSNRTLHLFSGSLPPGLYTRFDRRPDGDAGLIGCDIQGDAEELSEHLGERSYDYIFADPPYSEEDAARYGAPLVNRNKVVRECAKVIRPGGFLVWLDQVLPMYRKAAWVRCGEILITRSTNHRIRAAFVFYRRPDADGPPAV